MADSGQNKEKMKPKRIRNIKSARRLLAAVIYDFQKGAIRSDDAKTLAYLLIKYSELYKVESLEIIEKRLKELEAKI